MEFAEYLKMRMNHNNTESKSVAIITLQGKTNYGNRLQNYATTRIYQHLGFDVVSLVRVIRPSALRCAVDIARKMTSFAHDNMRDQDAERVAAFSRFDKSMAILAVNDTDKNLAQEFDYFSVGSDQVWNLGRLSDNDSWFYLKFARPEQRIALAPSIGVSELNTRQLKRLADGISGFRFLSVRERRGADLIKRCSGREAKVICDPTLVLATEEWRGVADDRLIPKSEYIFTYLLGGEQGEASDVVRQLLDISPMPVVPLSDKAKQGEPPAGPAEFVSLIDNAAHVVTDSFHAAVFACLLGTPLTIVHREGGTSMFSRLETLAQTFGIEHKIYGSPDFDLSRAGDYDGVSEVIERQRREFMSYLECCLDDQLPSWRDDAHA